MTQPAAPEALGEIVEAVADWPHTGGSNVGAVAAYASGGFQKLPDVTGSRRPG